MKTLVLGLVLGAFAAHGKVIDTPLGQLEGVAGTARNGDAFTAYYGVPFAEPPLGENRFRPPVPANPWSGVRDATKDADECLYEVPNMPHITTGSEDCLYLNVFTKHAGDASAKRPVLVWVHGGAFIFGGAGLYKPDHILEEDVVLVVLQYRLNIFGFLSFDDREAPGNYGMLDQNMALRWVQSQISAYGGDPDSVTLFGMSAGGASTHYHMLSPMSDGLFKNAISMSGSSLNWWASIPDSRHYAERVAENHDCLKETVKESVECLRNVDAEELFKSNRLFFEWGPDLAGREPMNVFSPRSDPESDDPFMPEHPIVRMENGKIQPVPYITGYAHKEGSWRLSALLPDVKSSPIWKDFLANYDTAMPLALGLSGMHTADVKKDMKKVNMFYNLDPKKLSQSQLTDAKVHSLIDVLSDTMFNFGIDTTAMLHAQHAHAPTYFYYLTYPANLSLANFGTEHVDYKYREPLYKPLTLATHGTDMLLLFPMFPGMGEYPESDVDVSRKLIKLIVDFAVNSEPTTVQWPEFHHKGQGHLVLDKEFKLAKGLPYQPNMNFWRGMDVYWTRVLKEKARRDEERQEERQEKVPKDEL